VHQQHASGQIRPPSQILPIPQPIETVILRALDRSPTKRFLTVRQFVDEVQRVGHEEVIELKATMAMGRVGRPKGELAQTLLGVRSRQGGGFVPIASAPTVNPQPAVSPMQQVTSAAATQKFESAPPAMAASPSPFVGMAPLTPPTNVDPARSPWASPGQEPAPAAPVVAAPVVAAPVVAAPIVAASPNPQASPAGRKKGPADDGDKDKGKFRETMWFKKGDLDAQAAVAAADERARTGKDVGGDKADSKAIDERYNDDGTITRGDKEKYSLRTGGTQMLPARSDRAGGKASQSIAKVSEDELLSEMKKLPVWLIPAIVFGVVALVVLVVMIAT
jgi:hypothetical protein